MWLYGWLNIPNLRRTTACAQPQLSVPFAMPFVPVATHCIFGDPMCLQLSMASDIAAGMNYLACCNFVLGDLSARHIMVSKDNTCCISGFGLSRDMSDPSNPIRCLNLRYAAVEILPDYRSLGIEGGSQRDSGNMSMAGPSEHSTPSNSVHTQPHPTPPTTTHPSPPTPTSISTATYTPLPVLTRRPHP